MEDKSKSPHPEITPSTVTKVADLIKIKLAEADLPKYAEQLNKVLDAVAVLDEIDTNEVEPTSQTHGLENGWREDEHVEPGLDMKNYKNTRNFLLTNTGGYFVVDKVL